MRKILAIFLTLFLLSTSGCSYLGTLRDRREEYKTGLIKAYGEALNRGRLDRIKLEKDYIDTQERDALIISAYRKKTGIEPSDVMTSNIFSLNEIQQHKQRYEDAYKKRLQDIVNSYDEFYRAIEVEQKKLNVIDEAIKEIQKEQKDALFSAIPTVAGSGSAILFLVPLLGGK